MPRAWLSSRVSTKEQLAGGGIRRQESDAAVRSAERWCAKRGYTLEGQIVFAGSAYKGRHMEAGAPQREWIEAAIRGELGPSPALMVENIDRFTREAGHKALAELLARAFPAGIVLVDLSTGDSYCTEAFEANDRALGDLLEEIRLAHRESKKKAKRLREYWEQVREDVAQGVVLRPNSIAPFWISATEDGTAWQFNELEPVARRMFAMAMEVGTTAISRQFNQEGVPTPGRRDAQGRRTLREGKWSCGGIIQHLKNPSAYGALRLNRGRRTNPDQEPKLIGGYFPALISREEWDLLQHRIAERAGDTSTRGRGKLFRWVALGISRCGCGAVMGVNSSGRGKSANGGRTFYLHCLRRRSEISDCSCPRYRLGEATAHLLSRLTLAQFSAMADRGADADALRALSQTVTTAEASLVSAEAAEQRAKEAVRSAVLAGQRHDVLLDIANETAASVAAARAERSAAVAALERAQQSGPAEPAIEAARSMLKAFAQGADTKEQRAELNAALKRLRLTVLFSNDGTNQIGLRIGDGPIAWQALRPVSDRLRLEHGQINLQRLEQQVVVGDRSGTASVAITDESDMAEAHQRLAEEVELMRFMLEQQKQDIDPAG